MRSLVTECLAAVSALGGVTGRAVADTKAELVSTAVAWEKSNHNTNPDLIRFGDRWFLACQESAREGWHGGTAIGRICGSAQTLQLMAGKDGKAFESRAEQHMRTLMPYDRESADRTSLHAHPIRNVIREAVTLKHSYRAGA